MSDNRYQRNHNHQDNYQFSSEAAKRIYLPNFTTVSGVFDSKSQEVSTPTHTPVNNYASNNSGNVHQQSPHQNQPTSKDKKNIFYAEWYDIYLLGITIVIGGQMLFWSEGIETLFIANVFSNDSFN